MAGGKAGIGRVAREVREVEGVGLAADERPAAADAIFQDFGDQIGHGDRDRNRTAAACRGRAAARAGCRATPAQTIATAISNAASTDSTYSSLPKSVRMRIHHSDGVPRFGIWAISHASIAYISTMIAAPRPADSHNACRAARRAASARRECDGERTSCASDSHASVAKREQVVSDSRQQGSRPSYSVPSERKIAIEIALPCEIL